MKPASGRMIYLVCSHFHPHIGGVERYVYQLAKNLAAQGRGVTVVTSNTHNVAEDEVLDSFRVLRLPVFNFLKGRYPIPLPTPSFFRLCRKIIKGPRGLFLINTRFFLTSHLGAWIARRKRSPAVLIEHGTGHFTLGNPVIDRIAHIYEHLATLALRPLITKCYGVSSACTGWLQHFGITSSGVIYNAVDSTYRVKEHVDVRKRFNVPEHGIVVSFFGRLLEEKGVVELLDAFDRIEKQDDRIYLFIAGDGPLTDTVKSRCAGKKRGFYLGRISYDAAMDLLDQTDIYIAPTRYPEGLPTVVLEAGGRGCAVVATAKGGTPEVITDDRFGRIIPENNIDAIVSRLIELSGNRELRKQLGRALQERIAANFDWTVSAQKVLDIEKELEIFTE